MIEIHGFPQSNFVWAVRIAAALKGVSAALVPTNPHEGLAKAVHPLGKVPVLRHGDIEIGESVSICRYIDAAFDGTDLAPSNASEAARHDQWVSLIQTAIEPVLIRQYVFAYLFPKGENGEPDRDAIDAIVPEVERLLGVVASGVERKAFAAERMQIADALLVPILFYTRISPEGSAAIAAQPSVAAYLDTALNVPAVSSTLPPPPADT
ncbi:MAG: glutathione S-transferase family protein [Pseudomonadota bacterium]